jgi:hypothetical protein
MKTNHDRHNILWRAGHRNGLCEGTLPSINECLSSREVYVDIIYDAGSAQESRIEIACGDYKHQDRLLGPGRRCLSLRIPYSQLWDIRELRFRSPESFTVERVVVRKDFYDFLGLRSRLRDNSEVISNEQKASQQGQLLSLMVNFFVEWRCDYYCPYCWQEVHSAHFRGKTRNRLGPHIWAAAFNRLRPHEIHFSGGEPLLYSHFPELISLIDPSIQLSIHTNFGPAFNIEEWRDHVPPGRVGLILLSYHPTECAAMSFFSKLERFQRAESENLGLQMVLHPSNLAHAREVLDRCQALRIPVRFAPYVPAEAAATGRAESLLAEMKRWIEMAQALCGELGANEFDCINYEMEQYWELPNRVDADHAVTHLDQFSAAMQRKSWGRLPIFCNAGTRQVVIDPEGYAYVCLSALVRARLFGPCSLPHYAPIGNILEEDFRLLDKPIICWESYRCNGDQFQHLAPAWTLASDRLKALPLPE